jgi:hypothetical protein
MRGPQVLSIVHVDDRKGRFGVLEVGWWKVSVDRARVVEHGRMKRGDQRDHLALRRREVRPDFDSLRRGDGIVSADREGDIVE